MDSSQTPVPLPSPAIVADPRLHTTRTRVLVIEDNPADRVLLKQRLGCITEPLHAGYAETLGAAEHMSDRNWDIVLLDLHLPGSRGLETLRRAQRIFPQTPIVVLTGLSDEELGTQAMQAGAQDYLVKSDYTAAVLQRTIRHSRERHKLNAELRAERERLNHILENTSEGIVAVAEDLSVQFANRAAVRILGQPLEEIVRTPWPHPLTTGTVTRVIIPHADGHEVVAELRSNRTRNQEGRLYLCTLRDTTEEERLQQSLIEREKMAAVGELSSGIAHEFNNLLAAVQANIELMIMRDPENDLARNILTATDRGKTLVQDLMTFNPHKAPQEGRTELREYFTNNREVINKLLGPAVRLQLDLPDQRWAVPMGPGMLNQVVINLTVNARDAMKDGGAFTISIGTRPVPRHVRPKVPPAPDQEWVCIAFADTGCGMPDDVRRKVFDAFFTTKGRRGNGLGLTAVFNLVHDCGGDIVVESEVGVGTCFEVWLPSYATTDAFLGGQLPRDGEAEGEPIRVLFVEDEELLRMAMSSYLETRGFDVTTASDGRAALDAIELTNRPFDVVVTDHMMPRLNGTDFIEEALKLMPQTVYILTSAYDVRMIGQDWPLFKQVNFLPKPYHGHELNDLIIRELKKPRSQPVKS